MDIFVGPRITRRKFVKLAVSAAAAFAGSMWTWSAASNARADERGITGRVEDLITGEPLAGVELAAVPDGPSTVSGSDGRYYLPLEPGAYEIRATAPGYIALTAGKRRPGQGRSRALDFRMIPDHVSGEQEAVLGRKLQLPPSSALYPVELAASGVLSVSSVPSTINVLLPDNVTVVTMDFEEYLRGVVPSEMYPTWHADALRAQAVAARSYAAYQVAHPRHWDKGAHVCTTTHCQVWRDDPYPETTNAAVADTRGVVATYGSSIISAFFFSQCNGQTTRNSEEALASNDSWKTCYVQGWSYVPYCRASSCGGHERYSSTCGYHGHGVGMCQWGAKAKAERGKGYMTIIHEYYTGVAIQGAPDPVSPGWIGLVQTNTLQRFQWTSAGDQHRLEVRRNTPDGPVYADSSWISATSWTTMFVEPGTYYWRVKARTGSAETVWSEARKLIVATTIYRNHLPLVSRNAP